MTRTQLAALVLIFLGLTGAPAQAAEKTPEEKPQLVLVLSGGGARGAAHIGVIRVLEELHIAPDLVVGTSMGSIIGGLYAAGWSADDMEILVQAIDWEQVFTDRVDRRNRTFRRKQDDRPVMIQTRLHFDGLKPVMPPGVIEGQRLELVLRTVEALSPATTDFDDLPIPFRAVAADIATGEAVVISSGSLASAMRASMSVPGALPPVELDGRELVDGGIAANLPVKIAQDLGAQRIIAVDITSPLLKEEDQQFDSFLSVFSHLNSLLTVSNRVRDTHRLTAEDLLIVPDLGDISFVSFDKLQEAIAIGEEAARLKLEELRHFTAGDDRWADFTMRPRAHGLASLEVDRVRLENTSDVDDRLVRKALKLEPPGIFDYKAIATDLLKLYNSRYFGVIGFQINEVEAGVHELVIETPPPAHGNGSMQFGLGFIDDFDGGSSYHIVARHQWLAVNRRGGEWATLLQLGTAAGATTAFYQPLDWGMNWFIEPSLSYARGTQEIWSEGTAVADYEFSSYDARLAVGRVLGRWGEIRLSAFTGNDRGSPRIGPPQYPTISERRGGGVVQFRVDTEDAVVFPTSGAEMNLIYSQSSESLGADTEFRRLQASAGHAWTFGKNTILPYIEYNDNLEPVESFFHLFPMGGLFRLSGHGNNELLGETTALARLVAYRQLYRFELAGMGIRIFAGLSLEAGNAFNGDETVSWGNSLKGGSVFIGGDTFVGPLIFSYGVTEGGRDRFYLAIGDRF